MHSLGFLTHSASSNMTALPCGHWQPLNHRPQVNKLVCSCPSVWTVSPTPNPSSISILSSTAGWQRYCFRPEHKRHSIAAAVWVTWISGCAPSWKGLPSAQWISPQVANEVELFLDSTFEFKTLLPELFASFFRDHHSAQTPTEEDRAPGRQACLIPGKSPRELQWPWAQEHCLHS